MWDSITFSAKTRDGNGINANRLQVSVSLSSSSEGLQLLLLFTDKVSHLQPLDLVYPHRL